MVTHAFSRYLIGTFYLFLTDFHVPSERKKAKATAIVAGTLAPAICILIIVIGILWKKGILGGRSEIDKGYGMAWYI